MLHVKTFLAPSGIHGTGLFAGQDIPKGDLVWRFVRKLDQRIELPLVRALPRHAMEALLHYGYINPENPHFVVLCFDDARFMNFHHHRPSTAPGDARIDGEADLVAARDLVKGEELTVGYDTDADFARKLGL